MKVMYRLKANENVKTSVKGKETVYYNCFKYDNVIEVKNVRKLVLDCTDTEARTWLYFEQTWIDYNNMKTKTNTD